MFANGVAVYPMYELRVNKASSCLISPLIAVGSWDSFYIDRRVVGLVINQEKRQINDVLIARIIVSKPRD